MGESCGERNGWKPVGDRRLEVQGGEREGKEMKERAYSDQAAFSLLQQEENGVAITEWSWRVELQSTPLEREKARSVFWRAIL